MKKLSIICMTVLAVFVMASCRGPMGPQGPAGNDGNANVASSTLTVYPNNWEWDCLFTDGQGHERGRYIVTIDYPAINNNVYNYGAVLVYMDVEGTWSQVPLTYYYSPDDDENGNPNLYEASMKLPRSTTVACAFSGRKAISGKLTVPTPIGSRLWPLRLLSIPTAAMWTTATTRP